MIFIKVGIIFCMLSVIIGAFGAHSLKDIISDKKDIFQTGVQYQIFHGFALIITGILHKILNINLNMAGYFFISGIIIFSGTLFLISIYKYSFLGAITPIGGVLFIIGWIFLFYKIM